MARNSEIELTSDAGRAFALVYEGKYLAGDAYFQEADDLRDLDPALYHLNKAAFDAVLNRYDDAQASVALARRALRQSLGSAVPSNSLVPDLIELYNKVFISTAGLTRRPAR